MSPNRELTYVQLNEQVTLQNQDPVLNECAARLGVSLSMFWGYKIFSNRLENLIVKTKATRGKI
jgi:hypothetical protein